MNVRGGPQKGGAELVESETPADRDPRRIARYMKSSHIPGLLVPPYDPPIRPCVPNAPEQWSTETTKDHEAALQRVPLPAGGKAHIFVTKRRWQAIDVYIDGVNDATGIFAGTNANAMLTINVYAAVRGILSLVTSGRTSFATIAQAPIWMASARQACEQWVVELEYNGAITATQDFFTDVAIIATDCEQDISEECLATRPVAAQDTLQSAAATVAYPTTLGGGLGSPFELLGLNASTVSATKNFLHVHDTTSAAGIVGQPPLYSFSCSVDISLGSSDLPSVLRRRRFRNGITLAISTTAITTTLQAAGVVGFNGYFR